MEKLAFSNIPRNGGCAKPRAAPHPQQSSVGAVPRRDFVPPNLHGIGPRAVLPRWVRSAALGAVVQVDYVARFREKQPALDCGAGEARHDAEDSGGFDGPV